MVTRVEGIKTPLADAEGEAHSGGSPPNPWLSVCASSGV